MSDPLIQMIKTQNQDIPVESWPTGIDGIVITMPPITEEVDGYRVTHQHSGFALVRETFPTIPIARLFVERIANFATWNCESLDLISDDLDDLRSKLNDAVAQLNEELSVDASKVIESTIRLSY